MRFCGFSIGLSRQKPCYFIQINHIINVTLLPNLCWANIAAYLFSMARPRLRPAGWMIGWRKRRCRIQTHIPFPKASKTSGGWKGPIPALPSATSVRPFTSGGGLILPFCRKASTMSWHRTPPCAHDFSSQRRGNPGNIRRIIRPFIFPYSILPCLPKKALITGRPQWRGSPFPWWAAPFFPFPSLSWENPMAASF